MEVHPHTHHERKTWKSYVWEFLMLFLAVFCGFLAEYQLEHKIEKDRTEELAKSFYQELKNDSITAELKVKNRLKQEEALDFMIKYIRDSSLTNPSKKFTIAFLFGVASKTPGNFEPRTTILEQLRNSGSLRYFKNSNFQQLTGELFVAIKNIEKRQEVEFLSHKDYLSPLIFVRLLDQQFFSSFISANDNIFENFAEYEKSNEVRPYKIDEPDKINRKEMINYLYLYNTAGLYSTRINHIKYYQQINAKLLKILRKEFDIKD